MNRRYFSKNLIRVAVVTAVTGWLPESRKRSNTDWNIDNCIQLQPCSSYDLNQTLPAGVKKGGRFSLHSKSTLPKGITLSPTGILTVDLKFEDTFDISGIEFSYDEWGGA